MKTNERRYTVTIGGRDGMDWMGKLIDGKGHEAFFIGRRGQAYQHYTGNQGRHTIWCWDLGGGGVLVELMADFLID